MVARLTLDQVVEVRGLLPQPALRPAHTRLHKGGHELMNRALTILLSAGVLSALTASVQVAVGEEAKPPKVPDLDAKYVKMKIPKVVLTDQVFSVAITVKNTGALA